MLLTDIVNRRQNRLLPGPLEKVMYSSECLVGDWHDQFMSELLAFEEVTFTLVLSATVHYCIIMVFLR